MGSPGAPLELAMSFGSWVLSLILMWIAATWMLRNIPRVVWNANPYLGLPLNVRASDSTVRFEREDRCSDYHWRAFINFRETAQIFMLYLSESTYEIIPKRGFASHADLQTFADFLKSTLAPAIPGSTAFKPSLVPQPAPVYVQPLESREFM